MTEEAKINISIKFPKTMGRKLLLGAGAAVIVLMLLVAAFSLGIYIGEHGWTQDGLALRRQGGGGDRPPAANTGAPGRQQQPGDNRPPDLVGRIRETMDDALLLATPDGPRTVELDEQTRIITREGDERPQSALLPGQDVAVFGHGNGDGQTLIADAIVLLPSPQGPGGGQPNRP